MIKSLSIIFPLYNESKRLKYCFKDIEKFNKNSKIKNLEYIFIDDGSLDNSYNLIIDFIKQKQLERKKIIYKIIKFQKNKGKGAALISGLKKASKDWDLTIDTDISVSLLEINNWIRHKYLKVNDKIYFGSRNLKNSIIKFEYHRKLIGLLLGGVIISFPFLYQQLGYFQGVISFVLLHKFHPKPSHFQS